MSVSFLFDRSQRRQGQIGSLTLEATLSENHIGRSNITRQAIEDGSSITDHIVNEPESVSIEGFISNTPISGGINIRTQDAFDTLYDIWLDKELVTVVTGYRVYSDMAITNLNVPRSLDIGQAIRFTVELTKINKVGSSSQSVFGDSLSSLFGANDQASSRLNLGRLTSQVPSPSSITRGNNVLGRLF